METGRLLEHCSNQLAVRELDRSSLAVLERWNEPILQRSEASTRHFMAASPEEWESLILEHPANRHRWYDYIRDDITVDEMAAFLLENKYFPKFLALLEKIRTIQVCEEGRGAVEENIHDEYEPEPHADLMRRLIRAVGARTQSALILSEHSSLIDRTLVFYYGYYCEPWHLVGSVFATERLGTRRVVCMDKGLRRLGLTDYELAFTIIHSECDDHHASDWLKRVIIPSIEIDSGVRRKIAEGITACLETSSDYLNYLLKRALDNRENEKQPVT